MGKLKIITGLALIILVGFYLQNRAKSSRGLIPVESFGKLQSSAKTDIEFPTDEEKKLRRNSERNFTEMNSIAKRFNCPCGECNDILLNCACESGGLEARNFLKTLLNEEKSFKEIKDMMIKKYGNKVLV